MNRLSFTFLLVVSSLFLFGQKAMQNTEGRNSVSLNGKWNYIIDTYETGYYDYRYQAYDKNPKPWGGFFLDQEPKNKTELIEYSFDQSPTLWVPGDWNSQDDKLLYYEGTIWYRKKFNFDVANNKENRIFVWFGAVNYESDIYLNGKKLGKHIGGFTPFQYEVTSLLKETGNSLVVKVDNKRKKEGVPTLNTDWWNYGGITRDVKLLLVPQTYIADYSIHLKKGTMDEIAGFVQMSANTSEVATIAIPELKSTLNISLDEKGKGTFTLKQKKLDLWSPENPKLYTVEIACGNDKIIDKIGFRSIETKGADILLNGKSIFLCGICIHEENALRGGRAHSMSDARMLLQSAKELNCNYVRLAHYPHSENMVRLADEMGILVWEEIPVYWTIQWENEETYKNAESQLTDVIQRDKNRASVIFWSIANETPVSEPRNRFLQNLAAHARSLDDTRLISAALEVHTDKNDPLTKIVEDPFAEYVDIVNFNQYIGWYDGTPEKCDRVKWQIKYNKPVMISEFGGGAVQGYYADSLTRWSEEYTEDLYRRTLKMLDKIPQFRGVTPWILYDFRSPRRVLPNVQDGWNRKGVIGQNGTKKKAFYVLRDFYLTKEASFGK